MWRNCAAAAIRATARSKSLASNAANPRSTIAPSPIGSRMRPTGNPLNRSDPIDARGIASRCGIMHMQIGSVGVREQALDDLFHLLPVDHFPTDHHTVRIE